MTLAYKELIGMAFRINDTLLDQHDLYQDTLSRYRVGVAGFFFKNLTLDRASHLAPKESR